MFQNNKERNQRDPLILAYLLSLLCLVWTTVAHEDQSDPKMLVFKLSSSSLMFPHCLLFFGILITFFLWVYKFLVFLVLRNFLLDLMEEWPQWGSMFGIYFLDRYIFSKLRVSFISVTLWYAGINLQTDSISFYELHASIICIVVLWSIFCW